MLALRFDMAGRISLFASDHHMKVVDPEMLVVSLNAKCAAVR